jgi:hypothetical protein
VVDEVFVVIPHKIIAVLKKQKTTTFPKVTLKHFDYNFIARTLQHLIRQPRLTPSPTGEGK